MERKLRITLVWVCIYAMAIAMLEAAVVIYLRELYYKDLPLFPLQPMSPSIALTEIAREAATIIMLAAVAFLAGKSRISRFAYFLISFALWDIFYYVFLKLFIGWPAGLLDWDILFLIPVPWIGPVLAPCLIALLMIALGLIMLYYEKKNPVRLFSTFESILFVSGCVIILGAFMFDYYDTVLAGGGLTAALDSFGSDNYFTDLRSFVPNDFPVGYFLSGYGLLVAGVAKYYLRLKNVNMVLF